MEEAIEVFTTITFVILGSSHVLQHDAWARFISSYAEQGSVGVFKYSFLALLGGSLIVSFHNVWVGLPALLTGIGWVMVLKSALAYLFPGLALRSMARVRPGSSHLLKITGAVMIGIGAALGASIWRRLA